MLGFSVEEGGPTSTELAIGGPMTIDKKSLSERDICTKFINTGPAKGRLGRDGADPRGGEFH